MGFILALDQGTTSSRAILFDEAGRIYRCAQQEFEQIFPKAGWVEHDPRAIWESQLAVARAVIREAGISPGDVAGIGITNQRETTVVWDRKTGEPIGNAIVWQDRRTADYCRDIEARFGRVIQKKTGLVVDPYFSASKLRWMLENISGARQRAERGELAFGTVDSWILWKLTGGGVHATDVSNASRTMLFNIRSLEWDEGLLGIMEIPREVLPAVKSSSEVFGYTSEGLFGKAIAIAGMAGDQQAALFGQACFDRGDVKCTYGTGCFLLMNVGDEPIESKHRLLSTIAWKREQQTKYAVEGSVFIGGAVVQWLRDGLGIVKSAGEVEALAATVADTGGVYLVPAFAGLGAPHWDPYARGTIAGITRGTTAAHLARAALESIAFQVADVMDTMREDSGVQIKQLRVDGGAAANNLLMQFQADLLGVPVVRPVTTETTALGAAYLAGLATGYWKSTQDIQSNWRVDRVFEPSGNWADIKSRRDRWKQALARSRDWEEHD